MANRLSFGMGARSVLFWLIISAAFIGPGTVTTASKAGATYGLSLLWALVFSTIATILLQEAAARITIASGKSLGEILAIKYREGNSRRLKVVVFAAILIGCLAYQAGNMLGAISGIALLTDFDTKWLTLALGLVVATLLWIGNIKVVANILGVIVALMGTAFLYVAFQGEATAIDFVTNAVLPQFPAGSSLLVIGLIGTTIVPYDLFLASGISKGQEIREMRWGIAIAVAIGGIISMAIMLVGMQVPGEFSFVSLANALGNQLGSWTVLLFGFGLFAAGMSSSVTSPLAASITAQSLFGAENPNWSTQSRNFRLVWGSIVLVGLLFGLSDTKPIPAIILAQAVNGVLLPVVTVFLLLAVNDRVLIPEKYGNSLLSNLLLLLIVGVTAFLGINNVFKAVVKVVPGLQDGTDIFYWAAIGFAVLLILWLGRKVWRK